MSVRDLGGLVNRVSAYLSVMDVRLNGGRVPASVVEGAVRAQGGLFRAVLVGQWRTELSGHPGRLYRLRSGRAVLCRSGW